MGVTPEELQKYLKNSRDAKAAGARKGKPRFKRSDPSLRTWGGVTYASVSEMRFAKGLFAERLVNPKLWWVRQPIFDLSGVQYRPDFLVVRETPEGTSVEIYEIKPRLQGQFRKEALRTFVRNAKQVQTLWGVSVTCLEV